MKTAFYVALTLLILEILAVNAQAASFFENSIRPGAYRFQNAIQVLKVKRTELIRTENQIGSERVKKLKSEGWTCAQQTQSLVQCAIFLKNEVLPIVLQDQLQQKYANFVISFESLKSSELINDSESLKEYDVQQQVYFDQLSVANYRLQVLKDGPTKLQIQFPNIKMMYFNVIDQNTIATTESLTVRNGAQSTLYFVQIGLN